MEVEAIGAANEIAKLREQCDGFLKAFGIGEGDLMEGSYSDMIQA